MAGRRIKRVENLLRDELVQVIKREMGDIVTPLMSITSVEVSKDLSSAKVYVSFLNSDESESNIAKLTKAEGFIRGILNRKIRIKRIPKLIFKRDETIAKAFRLEEIFESLHKDEQSDPSNN
jgi:ribosome-binding factor A